MSCVASCLFFNFVGALMGKVRYGVSHEKWIGSENSYEMALVHMLVCVFAVPLRF